MAEYIDREKLLMGIEALPCDGCTDIDCGECIQELIDDAEPEDVQPVRYGRWIYNEGTINTLPNLMCSKCGWWTIDHSVDGSYNYCPECGAKMDEGEDDG